ncbi:hypothetical protein Goarm_023038 [Gossypium armourianum]|uniref:Uncharacterized protein n=1 Tax=Gossypium armourianum TaxID=34283 RepID=A0A7J9KH03_9ROSI|nr:hypothetical protein [Gossypium armourianum]
MKWIWYGLSRNILPFSTRTLEIRSRYIGSRTSIFGDPDAMGKACGDRHLALFAFSVYRLIVFPKALGYVSVELADFLFHIEKRGESCSSSLS